MSVTSLAILAVCALLLVYLTFALLNPERF
jgi:K+-transporting ATPase KdpF subunit